MRVLCNTCITTLIFKSKTCGFCVQAMGEFAKLKKMETEKAGDVMGYHVEILDVQDNPEIFDDFAIQGYPTILFYEPETRTFVKYTGKREALEMRAFAYKLEKNRKNLNGMNIWHPAK